MSVQLRLLPGAISDLFAQTSSSKKITLADRYGLLAALLEDSITEEERASIDRVLYSLYRRRMQVVSEISALSSPSSSSLITPSIGGSKELDRITGLRKPSVVSRPAHSPSQSSDQSLKTPQLHREPVRR
jgi:hypothetical protein